MLRGGAYYWIKPRGPVIAPALTFYIMQDCTVSFNHSSIIIKP